MAVAARDRWTEQVTRWAGLVKAELERRSYSGDELWALLAVLLAHIHVESKGDPSAYNQGSCAVGLGQTLQWVDGDRWLGGPKRGKAYIHPRATINGMSVSWEPSQQVYLLVSVFCGHYERNAGQHLPSASHCYASGAGNVKKIVEGSPVPTGSVHNQHHDYIPRVYLALAPQYAAWASTWRAGGTRTVEGEVRSGKGSEARLYPVPVLAPSGLALDDGHVYAQPFDGKLCYRGTCVRPAAWGRAAESGAIDWRLKAAATVGGGFLVKKLINRLWRGWGG